MHHLKHCNSSADVPEIARGLWLTKLRLIFARNSFGNFYSRLLQTED